MIDPGRLNRRLVLEAPVETPDGAGGVLRDHAPVATLWAAVEPVAARPQVLADAAGAAVTHRILIRRRAGVTTRHRLRDGVRTFRIVSLREAAGHLTEILAEERGG